MPLPCTPVSMSEREDSSQSHSVTEASGSEDGNDLITPRPGPSDPLKRTPANLSTPLPALDSWSDKNSAKKLVYPTTSEDDGEEPAFPSKLPPGYIPPHMRSCSNSFNINNNSNNNMDIYAAAVPPDTLESERDSINIYAPRRPTRGSQSGSSDGSSKRPRAKRNISSTTRRKSPRQAGSPRHSPSRNSLKRESPELDRPTVSTTATSGVLSVPERAKSITFSPAPSQRASPDAGYHSTYTMLRKRDSPAMSPHARASLRDDQDFESSADENTAIFRRTNSSKTGVGTGCGGSSSSNAFGYGTNGADPAAAAAAAATILVNNNAAATQSRPRLVAEEDDEVRLYGYEGAAEEEPPGTRDLRPVERRRKSGNKVAQRNGKRAGARNSTSEEEGGADSENRDGVEGEEEGWLGRGGWLSTVFEKYGSVELENKGSVARDHLALERTFLAWLRTSLSFASIGIAVTQLFRLNTTTSGNNGGSSSSSSVNGGGYSYYSQHYAVSPAYNLLGGHGDDDVAAAAGTAAFQAQQTYDYHRIRQVGKPLGATFLGVSILILLLGFHRYFESQHYVIRGKFPASRGSIVVVAAVSAGLIITSLVVVIAIAPGVWEK